MATQVKDVTNLSPGDHACMPYTDEEERQALLTAYVKQGLLQGEKVLYLSDQAPETKSWLQQQGADYEEAVAKGALVVRDARESYLPNGFFSPEEAVKSWQVMLGQALQEGYTGLRGTGETKWLLGDLPGIEKFVDFEIIGKHGFAPYPLTMLCQFDRHHFDDRAIKPYVEAHDIKIEIRAEALYQDEQLQILPTPRLPGMRLIGEVDIANHQALAEMLAQPTLQQGTEVHLDVSALKFIDVQGAWLLIEASRRLPAGHRLLLHDPPSVLQRILKIIWPQSSSLEIDRRRI